MARSRLLVHGSLAACAAMWGLVFVGIHELLPVMTAVQLVTIRFLIICFAFLLFLACVPSLRARPRGRAGWVRFAVCGLLAVPGAQLTLVESQRYLSPQLASLVVAISPVLTALFAAALLDERLTVVRIVGSVIALVGVIFIVLFGPGGGGIGHVTFSLPAITAMISPISWSLYTVFSRPLAGQYPPVAPVGLSLTMGTVVLLPFTVDTARALPALSIGDWGWVAFLSLGGSLLPYLIWYWSLRTLPANRVAAYMYAVPLFAMVFTWLILHKPPDEVAGIGAAFVLVGVVLTQTQGTRRHGKVTQHAVAIPVGPALVDMEEA